MSPDDVLKLLDGLRERGLLERVASVEHAGTKLVFERHAPDLGERPGGGKRDNPDEDFDPYASSHGGSAG
jgi:hypothetical protein